MERGEIKGHQGETTVSKNISGGGSKVFEIQERSLRGAFEGFAVQNFEGEEVLLQIERIISEVRISGWWPRQMKTPYKEIEV